MFFIFKSFGGVGIKGIYDEVIEEINRRNIQDAEKFAAFYMISYACHLFHMHNGKNFVYLVNGRIINFRLHMLFEAPPGYGKSLMLALFGNDQTGIFKNCSVQMASVNYTTGAGFVGSMKTNADGETYFEEGVAMKYRDGIIMIDEFNGMLQAMENTRMNGELKPQLLTFLDSGDVSKALGPGSFSYHSDGTLWTGIQPMKSDLSDGLGRRFCFLLNLPTVELRQKYKDSRKRAGNIKNDVKDLLLIREHINSWVDTFGRIKGVAFSKEFEDFLDKTIDAEHYEFDIYERIGLGYWLVKYGATDYINVELTDELKKLILLQHDWRWKIKREPRIQTILEIIRKNGERGKDGLKMHKSKLVEFGAHLELNVNQIQDVLEEAGKYGYIKIRGSEVVMDETADVISPAKQICKSLGLGDL